MAAVAPRNRFIMLWPRQKKMGVAIAIPSNHIVKQQICGATVIKVTAICCIFLGRSPPENDGLL